MTSSIMQWMVEKLITGYPSIPYQLFLTDSNFEYITEIMLNALLRATFQCMIIFALEHNNKAIFNSLCHFLRILLCFNEVNEICVNIAITTDFWNLRILYR